MTNNDQWRKSESYHYLRQLEGRDHIAGWAWEFIRRSKIYREAYADFHDLRKQYGADWLAKQPRNLFDPEKLPGESDNAWHYRVSGMGLVITPISASQQRARAWQLMDMYDPQSPYDANYIQFVAKNPFPAFYADTRVIEIPAIQPFEDLQHDYLDKDTAHLLFVAFDVTRPVNEQIKKLRTVFGKYRKRFDTKSNDYKGHEDQWEMYIRMLDARDSEPELSYIDAIKIIGMPTMRHDPYAAASEIFEHAEKMANDGYKGLLFQLANH